MEADAIELDDHPELALLAERISTGAACRLTRNGKTVARVTPEPTWVDTRGRGPDWQPSEDDINRALGAAGSWADVDTEEFIANIRRWRDEAPVKPPVEL